MEEKPRTFSELGQSLSYRWPAHPPAALAQGVRALVPLVQVPPRGEPWLKTARNTHSGVLTLVSQSTVITAQVRRL